MVKGNLFLRELHKLDCSVIHGWCMEKLCLKMDQSTRDRCKTEVRWEREHTLLPMGIHTMDTLKTTSLMEPEFLLSKVDQATRESLKMDRWRVSDN